MEFVTAGDIFATASLALLLSFLVAKLVSLAMASDPDTTTNKPHEPIVLHEVCCERFTVQSAQGESKVEFLSPIQVSRNVEIEHHTEEIMAEPNVVKLRLKSNPNIVSEPSDFERFTVRSAQRESKVEFLSPIQVARDVEIEHDIGENTIERTQPHVAELPVKSTVVSEPCDANILREESAEEKATEVRMLNEKTVEFDRQAVSSAEIDDSAKQRNTEFIEEIRVDPSTEMGIYAESNVESGMKERDEKREVALDFDDDDDDDDWEEIERSELEKVFMAATEFVAGNEDHRLSSKDSEAQMELYALHKVATEGPCHVPQPMALKLSARAKWNAWQNLGNMSPEVAMEQYITLLSDKIPGWMKDNSAGRSEQESTGSVVLESAAPDISTSLSHQQIIATERELEQESSTRDHSPPTESDLENNVRQ